jgi:hypothetical protein
MIIQWIQGAFCLGVRQQEREANHSLPCSTKAKNSGEMSPLPLAPSLKYVLEKLPSLLPFGIKSVKFCFDLE